MTNKTVVVPEEKKVKQKQKNHGHAVQNRLFNKFLNETVVIVTNENVKIKGRLTEYDQYALAIEVKEEEILIFKHAIAYIRPFNSKNEK